MYSLHRLAWGAAHEQNRDEEQAEDLVRRCEVVIAGIHRFHAGHRVSLSTAHGEGALDRFLSEDRLDVAQAVQRDAGLSAGGFADVYQGPCVAIGALTPEQYPRPCVRADVPTIRAGLGDLLELAVQASLTVARLRAAEHLYLCHCLCQAAEAPDGRWLRRVLVEDAGDRADDRARQLTSLLLLEALHRRPSADATAAFRDRWAFGPPERDPGRDARGRSAVWACPNGGRGRHAAERPRRLRVSRPRCLDGRDDGQRQLLPTAWSNPAA